MRLLALTVWVFVSITFIGVFAYGLLLWSQFWRQASRRSSGVAVAARRRPVAPVGNDTIGGGVLLPNKMAPLPKDKLLAKVDAYRTQLELQLRRAQWQSNRPVGAGGQPPPKRYGVRSKGSKARQFADPEELLRRARHVHLRMLDR